MILQTTIVVFLALGSVLSFAQSGQAPGSDVSAVADSGYIPVRQFDPKRNAAADIRAAITEAQRTRKRIILDVGGDWCFYCHQMDQLFQEHSELVELRDKNFITVDIYYGPGQKNEQVLAHYSRVLGIPHFFVLDKDGTLLHSQHLRDLRERGKYSPEKMKEFLIEWLPHPESTANAN